MLACARSIVGCQTPFRLVLVVSLDVKTRFGLALVVSLDVKPVLDSHSSYLFATPKNCMFCSSQFNAYLTSLPPSLSTPILALPPILLSASSRLTALIPSLPSAVATVCPCRNRPGWGGLKQEQPWMWRQRRDSRGIVSGSVDFVVSSAAVKSAVKTSPPLLPEFHVVFLFC